VGSMPPDSPDLIPIETMSPRVKESLRSLAARATGAWSGAMGEVVEQVRPLDLLGWSRSWGVCATPGLKLPGRRACFQRRVSISWRVRHP
jgi:hypothetical protein